MASTKARIRTGVLSLGVLATLGTGLVACGGDDDGGNNNDSPTTAKRG